MRRPLVLFALAAWLLSGACAGKEDYSGTTIVYVVADASAPDDAAIDASSVTDDASSMLDAALDASPADAGNADVADDAVIDAQLDSKSDALGSATCHDNVKDGDETDVDCGGSCAPCALGQGCMLDSDCSATAAGCNAAFGGCRCDKLTRTCAADHCSDHKTDDGESDVDCGGGQCGGCGPNKACHATSDCSATASGCDTQLGGCACDLITSTCVYNHCFDQRKDSSESDVDCGGGDCNKCALSKGCYLDFDCTTNACDGISNLCVPNQCLDHRVDGLETDIDCGGPDACSRCVVGQKCKSTGDCQAGHTCSAPPQVCL
jgi:hypothetical protein